MNEKRLLENLLVAQTLVIADQIRRKDKEKGSNKNDEWYLEIAVDHIEKNRDKLLHLLRAKGLC